jgi:hypothetical protein
LNTDLLTCLFKAWGHSREEDGDGLTVYRPQGYKFPLSRGRDWLEFKPDGTVLFLGAGPDDRNRAVQGTWSSTGERSLKLSRGAGAPPQRLTIVECSDAVLKVRYE